MVTKIEQNLNFFSTPTQVLKIKMFKLKSNEKIPNYKFLKIQRLVQKLIFTEFELGIGEIRINGENITGNLDYFKTRKMYVSKKCYA